MNNLFLSQEVRNDLAQIKAYIEEELDNPQAALSVVGKLTKSIRLLGENARVGSPLSSVADVNSDYRFIVSGNYLVFYRVSGNQVYVDRILHKRRDYLRIILGGNGM